MNRGKCARITVWLLALSLAVAASAAPAVEIKLKDGSKWRGEVADLVQVRYLQQGVEVPLEGKLTKVESLYIVVDGMVAGVKKQVTIFKSDIVSMSTVDALSVAVPESKPTTATSSPGGEVLPTTTSPKAAKGDPTIPGVFMLPMEGGVGESFRHEEIQKLADYIDKNYPPGQIIVLRINSNGGSSYETQKIGGVIREVRKRHRVVSWVEKAISAGCQTAMYCNEIYFMTQGTAGSVTTWSGNLQAVRGEMLDKILEEFVEIAEENGYHRSIALAMKMNEYMCTYDKDPVTGEVTFYDDMSGQYKLSDANSNLCFTSSNALHCGFSDGTADTPEELAKLLNLPKWNEIDDYGRRIAKEWQRTCEQAQAEIPLIASRLQYKNTSTGDPVVIIGTRIQLLQDASKWWDRCHNVCEMMGMPPKDLLEREITELKKQLADIRRAQR